MCRWAEVAFTAVVFVLASTASAAAEHDRLHGFGFGRPASAAAIAGWDIDVRPDGAGLPDGRGSAAQGQVIYDAKCADCHGTFGEANSNMQIAGGVGSLRSDQPVRTTGSKLNYATTLFDYIRRAMPLAAPQSLAPDELYALTAYVLYLNDILPLDATLDRRTLPQVRMPNRDGYTTAHGMMREDGKPDTANVACMRACGRQVRVVSEMAPHAIEDHGELSTQRRPLGGIAGFGTSASALAVPTRTAAEKPLAADDIARRAGCMACHAVEHKLVGPGFREVADRYKSDAETTQVQLLVKLRQGGAGAWGDVPMPAQPQVSEADAKAVVEWILRGAR